jgi:hypothetical protein
MEKTKVGSSEELGFVETLKLTFTYWARKLPYFMLPYLLFALISTLIIFGILAAVGFDLGFLLGVSYVTDIPSPPIDWATQWQDVLPTMFVGIAVAVIITVFFELLIEGMLVKYTADLHQEVDEISLKDSLSHAVSRLLSLLGATILIILIILGIVAVGIAIIFALVFTLAGTGNVLAIIAGALLGVLIMVVLIIIVTTYFTVAIQSVILEDSGAVQSLKRSWHLVKGKWWLTFILGIVIAIVTGIIGIIGGAIASITTILIVSIVISTIISAIISPIEIIAFTLWFFNLKAIKG